MGKPKIKCIPKLSMQLIDEGQPHIRYVDGNSVTVGYASSYGSYTTHNGVSEESENLLEQYHAIPEILIKVKKLKKYAEKNEIIISEVLETFLTEEELNIYSKREIIISLALKIIKEKEDTKIKATQDLDNYIQPHESRTGTTAGDVIGIHLSNNTKYNQYT